LDPFVNRIDGPFPEKLPVAAHVPVAASTSISVRLPDSTLVAALENNCHPFVWATEAFTPEVMLLDAVL
jgi:hypothetical protein